MFLYVKLGILSIWMWYCNNRVVLWSNKTLPVHAFRSHTEKWLLFQKILNAQKIDQHLNFSHWLWSSCYHFMVIGCSIPWLFTTVWSSSSVVMYKDLVENHMLVCKLWPLENSEFTFHDELLCPTWFMPTNTRMNDKRHHIQAFLLSTS